MEDKADLIAQIGNPLVAEPLLNVPYPYTEKDADEWISSREAAYNAGESVNYAVTLRSTNEFLGGCGITFNHRFNMGEIGYWIGESNWGKGYTTEAASALIDWIFRETELNRIFARHKSDNTASGRVMQKLGMQFEGILRQHAMKDGVYSDMVYYGILRSEWRYRQQTPVN